MAKTNSKGYFCDVPCGFMNSMCQNFFCAGCASAGIKLAPNTEYPDVKRVNTIFEQQAPSSLPNNMGNMDD